MSSAAKISINHTPEQSQLLEGNCETLELFYASTHGGVCLLHQDSTISIRELRSCSMNHSTAVRTDNVQVFEGEALGAEEDFVKSDCSVLSVAFSSRMSRRLSRHLRRSGGPLSTLLAAVALACEYFVHSPSLCPLSFVVVPHSQ